MKKIGYLLFAMIFHICRCIPVQQKKVVLYNGHHLELSGNLLAMKQEILRHGDDNKFYYYGKHSMRTGGVFRKISRVLEFFLVLPFQMATAGQIFFNDNFLPLGYCHPSEKTQLVQLWHGAGAFKKFGLSTETDRKIREQVKRANQRITHLFVTSKQVIPFYSEAFAIPYEKIYATGIPITDIYCIEEEHQRGKERFYHAYPELKGKNLLLITPTFRNTPEENRLLLENLALEKMEKKLGEEWVILLRMHPKYPVEGLKDRAHCKNLTTYPQVSDLYFVSDMLMTDYSSTVVEYVLLDKPMIFYAYDLEKYDRGFYREYEESVPGAVAHNMEEMLDLLGEERTESEKREHFRRMQYDFRDADAAERIWKVLVGQQK